MKTPLNPVLIIRVLADAVTGLSRFLTHLTQENRYQIDRDAREMQTAVIAPLTHSLSQHAVRQLKRFGHGQGPPIVLVLGLPSLRNPPPTPADGFGDDSRVAGMDAILLALFGITGLHPIAYAHENGGKLMRDVVASLGSPGEASSHGYDRRFGEHTDNPAGPFELESWTGSPIPRVLAFHCLRNWDASGRSVPTDILPLADILGALSDKTCRVLRKPAFRINPPASNRLSALDGVPLLVADERDGGPFFRYDGNKDGVVPRVEGLTADARKALAELQEVIDQSTAVSIDLQPGRALLIDNYRVLHARRAYDPGPDWKHARWLRRCYGCHNADRGTYVDRIHSPFVWA